MHVGRRLGGSGGGARHLCLGAQERRELPAAAGGWRGTLSRLSITAPEGTRGQQLHPKLIVSRTVRGQPWFTALVLAALGQWSASGLEALDPEAILTRLLTSEPAPSNMISTSNHMGGAAVHTAATDPLCLPGTGSVAGVTDRRKG